jgi:hypothetical protein
MKVTIQYFPGCPHVALAEERLAEVLPEVGLTAADIVRQAVDSPEQAAVLNFHGSPAEGAPVGFACRVYPTPDGPQGSPTVSQLREVLTR